MIPSGQIIAHRRVPAFPDVRTLQYIFLPFIVRTHSSSARKEAGVEEISLFTKVAKLILFHNISFLSLVVDSKIIFFFFFFLLPSLITLWYKIKELMLVSFTVFGVRNISLIFCYYMFARSYTKLNETGIQRSFCLFLHSYSRLHIHARTLY